MDRRQVSKASSLCPVLRKQSVDALLTHILNATKCLLLRGQDTRKLVPNLKPVTRAPVELAMFSRHHEFFPSMD